MKPGLLFSFLFVFITGLSSQTLTFQNPSFEGTAQPHVTPPSWNACIPGCTPDTQPGSWGITMAASDGSTYVGLVHDYSTGWQEGVSQNLFTALTAGHTYTLSVDIATTNISGSGIVPGAAQLSLFGGTAFVSSGCDASELLWTSGDLYNGPHINQWVTHTFTFTPSQAWDQLLFLIETLDTAASPYVMIDNLVSGTVQPGITISVIQPPTCYNSCDGEAYVDATGLTPPIQYLWSNGSTASSVSNLCAGELSVIVTAAMGATYYDTVQISAGSGVSPLSSQQVCIATVDLVSGKNRIVWEKPVSVAIDSFYVQRETAIPGQYTTVGKIAYADVSEYLDMSSDPSTMSSRYVVRAVDTCGRLTNAGTPHKTIHLDITSGIGGAWNLSWNAYQGFSYSNYLIFRGTSPASLALYSSVTSTYTTFNDATPPAGTLYYAVVAQKSSACNPTEKVLSSYFSSYSNVVCTGGNGIQDNLSVPLFTVKPNPATDYITVTSQLSCIHASFIMTDVTGREVLRQMITETEMKVETGELTPGVYFGSVVKEGKNICTTKIIIDENVH